MKCLSTMIEASCMIPFLCGLFRNDSLLDIMQHRALYVAAYNFLIELSSCQQLETLVGSPANSSSICALVHSQRNIANVVLKHIKKVDTHGKEEGTSILDEEDEDEEIESEAEVMKDHMSNFLGTGFDDDEEEEEDDDDVEDGDDDEEENVPDEDEEEDSEEKEKKNQRLKRFNLKSKLTVPPGNASRKGFREVVVAQLIVRAADAAYAAWERKRLADGAGSALKKKLSYVDKEKTQEASLLTENEAYMQEMRPLQFREGCIKGSSRNGAASLYVHHYAKHIVSSTKFESSQTSKADARVG